MRLFEFGVRYIVIIINHSLITISLHSVRTTLIEQYKKYSVNLMTSHTISTIFQYVEIKCQLDATEVFIADLITCSTCFGRHYAHHQELKSIIQWLLPVVFRAVLFKLLVWCAAEGYVSGLQDAAASCKPDT